MTQSRQWPRPITVRRGWSARRWPRSRCRRWTSWYLRFRNERPRWAPPPARPSRGPAKGPARREGRPMSILDPIKGFGVTFGTMFRGVVTEDYPVNPAPVSPRYRMRHRLNRHPDGLEKCIRCELCAWACPADAIYVAGGSNTPDERYSPGERYAKDYQINYLRCIGCGMCVEACPTRSLTMINEYETADDDRQNLIYTKEQLLAPLLPGME